MGAIVHQPLAPSQGMYNVLQVGTYSSKNKGDAAMEISTAQALQRELHDVRVVISSPFPELDRASYKEYTVGRSRRRRLIWGTLLLARAFAWRSVKERTGVALDFLVRDAELADYLAADLVVDLSGDMLTEDYGVHVAYSHYLPILTGLALRKPIAVCAQSIGPFKWTKALSRRILNSVDLVTARDPITYEYLRSIGVDNPSLRLTADMAFLLVPASASRTDEILREEGVDMSQGPVLGVSVSGLIRSKYERSNPLAKQLPFAEFLAQTLDSVSAKLGCGVLFVSHVTGPSTSKDDRLVAQAVQARMSRPSRVLAGDYDPRELKSIISRTQLFFGARMHANIAALSSAVPTVAISYSHKTLGIMDLLNQRERVVSIASMTREQCEAQLLAAWGARDAITQALLARLPAVATLARENVTLLCALLADRPSAS